MSFTASDAMIGNACGFCRSVTTESWAFWYWLSKAGPVLIVTVCRCAAAMRRSSGPNVSAPSGARKVGVLIWTRLVVPSAVRVSIAFSVWSENGRN